MQKKKTFLLINLIVISIFGTLLAINLVSASNLPKEGFWNPLAVNDATSGPISSTTTTTTTTTTEDGNGGPIDGISPGFEIIAILLSFTIFSAVIWRRRR
ncbi:MAG: hypothetical protein JSV04_07920 [Candidatus Heimdallarchaeota archaeon]|nr:MAG: hypothetical protein JSV04_07920 [Candidatus Heimdallarchaeota archaeon]